MSGATPFLGYTVEPPGCSPEGPGIKKSIFRERSAWAVAQRAVLRWIELYANEWKWQEKSNRERMDVCGDG
ncbi:hypothetical protein WR30_26125 [Burkholderia contaminans FFH2055]|nr:hypothetical protein WR30_26125 [Burkholderia contaminans FFH2055]